MKEFFTVVPYRERVDAGNPGARQFLDDWKNNRLDQSFYEYVHSWDFEVLKDFLNANGKTDFEEFSIEGSNSFDIEDKLYSKVDFEFQTEVDWNDEYIEVVEYHIFRSESLNGYFKALDDSESDDEDLKWDALDWLRFQVDGISLGWVYNSNPPALC